MSGFVRMTMNRDGFVWNNLAPLEGQTILARYVMEGLPEIETLVEGAQTLLEKNTGDPSFDAYVSGNPRRVKEQRPSMLFDLCALEETEPVNPTVDPADIRGFVTTLLASVGCLPHSRHEYALWVS
jgi:hypothetical protein